MKCMQSTATERVGRSTRPSFAPSIMLSSARSSALRLAFGSLCCVEKTSRRARMRPYVMSHYIDQYVWCVGPAAELPRGGCGARCYYHFQELDKRRGRDAWGAKREIERAA